MAITQQQAAQFKQYWFYIGAPLEIQYNTDTAGFMQKHNGHILLYLAQTASQNLLIYKQMEMFILKKPKFLFLIFLFIIISQCTAYTLLSKAGFP